MEKKPKTRFLSKLVDFLLNYLFDPLFFVTAVAPLIVEGNYFKYTKFHTETTDKVLVSANLNPYTFAIISYNIQYFVLLIVTVFFVVETAVACKPLVKLAPIPRVHNVAKESFFTKALALFFSLILFFLVLGFIMDTFAKININLYLDDNKTITIPLWGKEILVPPFSSPITQFRLVIAVYALLLARWKTKELPTLIEKLKKGKSIVANSN